MVCLEQTQLIGNSNIAQGLVKHQATKTNSCLVQQKLQVLNNWTKKMENFPWMMASGWSGDPTPHDSNSKPFGDLADPYFNSSKTAIDLATKFQREINLMKLVAFWLVVSVAYFNLVAHGLSVKMASVHVDCVDCRGVESAASLSLVEL